MSIGPIPRLAFGLVGLLTCCVLVADLLFGIVPDTAGDLHEQRVHTATGVTRQLLDPIASGEHRLVERTLDEWRATDPSLLSIRIQDAAGRLIAASGALQAAGKPEPAGVDRVLVPIVASGQTWGEAVFRYESSKPHGVEWYSDRRLWLALLLPLVATLLAYAYLRRALHYLDPEAVVPDRLRIAFDVLSEGVALIDTNARIVMANRSLRELLGADEHGLHGKRLADVFPCRWPAELSMAPWQQVLSSGEGVIGIAGWLRVGEGRRPGRVNCAPVTDIRGKVRGCLVTFADLTDVERQNAELLQSREKIEQQNQALIKLANYDGLTELLNRRSYFEQAEAAIERCSVAGQGYAVFMIDVDHFKSFNDKYGHSTGDAVLKQVAACARDAVRPTDLVGRYGGEEFSAFIVNIGPDQAKELAERVREAIQARAGLGIYNGEDLQVTASIGVAVAHGHRPGGFAALLQQADESLYEAKRGGRNRVVLHRSGDAVLTADASNAS